MKKNVLLFVAVILILFGCKKEDNGDTVYLSNGTVNVSLKGNKTDNTTLDEKFGLNTYLSILEQQNYYSTPQGYNFNVDFSNPDGSGISFGFILSSLTDITPDISDFSIYYYKKLDNLSVYYFTMGTGNNFVSVSDFTFNATSGQLKAKVTLTGTNNSTGKNATVEANYDLIVRRIDH